MYDERQNPADDDRHEQGFGHEWEDGVVSKVPDRICVRCVGDEDCMRAICEAYVPNVVRVEGLTRTVPHTKEMQPGRCIG